MYKKSKTPSINNAAHTCISELALAEKELNELITKIKKSGPPPHADFWHQSLHEAKERVRKSKACQLQL